MHKNIINTTPHIINFKNSDGTEFEVRPCGVVISATASEESAGMHPSGASLVRVRFTASPEQVSALEKIEVDNPGSVIVGSIIAAQAFPGRVLAMVPAKGFERVPTDQKRMDPNKFTTF
jgi:hypothetical protein